MLEDRIRVGQVARLDGFHADQLGCSRAVLEAPGLHVVASARRVRPGWGGYTVPLLALSTSGGGVVSVRPDVLDRVRVELASRTEETLGEPHFERLRRIAQSVVPYAYNLSGYVLFADADHFQRLSSRAEQVDRRDSRAADLRRRFDGEIFAVRTTRGDIVSWAAIKLKSDEVWEIAVVTEPSYRGQGLAKEVVSSATDYIISQGRTSLYVHDRTNAASARVCRSLGYVEYAEQFFSEY
ncbi:MAG: GNAT family N-acetyltransferase [Chloroflexi bacterium]|nr:GNAT family N-acetyltransferase [Chloroflexota bacterium]